MGWLLLTCSHCAPRPEPLELKPCLNKRTVSHLSPSFLPCLWASADFVTSLLQRGTGGKKKILTFNFHKTQYLLLSYPLEYAWVSGRGNWPWLSKSRSSKKSPKHSTKKKHLYLSGTVLQLHPVGAHDWLFGYVCHMWKHPRSSQTGIWNYCILILI